MELIADQCQGPFASISRAQTMGEYGAGHHQPLHTPHSFSRLETTPSSPLSESRASNLENETTPGKIGPEKKALQQGGNSKMHSGDIFDKSSDSSSAAATTSVTSSVSPQVIPEGFDELPIELISLTDRYEHLYYLHQHLLKYEIYLLDSSSRSLPKFITLRLQLIGYRRFFKTFT